jgi:hypothetical protein
MRVRAVSGQPLYGERMVLPVAANLSSHHQATIHSLAMDGPRVPPHPGFYCRLRNQPDHLVPQYQLEGDLAAKGESRHLFLNPECHFMNVQDLPGEFHERAWVTDGFTWEPNEVVALVHDPGTGTLQPFWLDAELGALLASRRQDAIPFLSSCQRLALTLAGILVPRDHSLRRQELWSETISRCATQFAQRGYAPIAGLIHPLHLSALRRYYRQLVRSGRLSLGDSQNPRRYGAHNEVVARFFHHALVPVLSAIAREPIKPSYVYLGAYQEGAELGEHRDRSQCEFSVTLCLDYTPEPRLYTPWPIKLRTPEGQTTVFQAIGDGLLYRGCRLPHSRGRLPTGHTSTSLFFHYVAEDFEGPLS